MQHMVAQFWVVKTDLNPLFGTVLTSARVESHADNDEQHYTLPPSPNITFRKSGKGLDLSSLFMLHSLESAFSQADIQMKDFKVIFNPNQL